MVSGLKKLKPDPANCDECDHQGESCSRFAVRKNFFGVRLRETYQLIVGPVRWATKVLRQTYGERFMADSETSIFIDRSGNMNFQKVAID